MPARTSRSRREFRFANAGNRNAFTANPGRRAPLFGGFCAMGVAMGKKPNVNPQLRRIVDGKVHLDVRKAARTRFLDDVKGKWVQAARSRPEIKDKMPRAL